LGNVPIAPSRLAEWRRLAPFYGYQVGAAIAHALPAPIAIGTAQFGGVLGGRILRQRREMITRHLGRIYDGDVPSGAVDRAFASYGRYWLDAFRLPNCTPDDMEAGMCYEGIGHVEEARVRGQGVIMAMPHLGAWDWGGAWLASAFPLTVVVEALEPPELFEWFAEWRSQVGMGVVPLGREAASGVMAALRAGGVVGLLCDRDLTGDGIEVSFFGERTRLPGGPATLAVRTGAPLLPCCVLFEGDHRRGIVLPPLDTARRGGLREDVTRVTQDLADALAGLIRRAPEQWHVFQPNWPSDPGYQ
jgi:lauroyl/myristoyl acyltransferase